MTGELADAAPVLDEDGLQARDVALALADQDRVLELTHRVPEAQVEDLLVQLAHPRHDLIFRHVADLLRLQVSHLNSPPGPAARRTSS